MVPDVRDIGCVMMLLVSNCLSHLDNKERSSGFLLWISSYCINCVFQWYARQKLSSNVFVYNYTKHIHAPKVFCYWYLVCSIQSKVNYFETMYEIAFLRCSMWTVKYWKETNNKKTWICFRDCIKWKKERKIQLNGCRGRTRTSFKYVYLVCKYGSMDQHEKEKLHSKHQQKYKLMDPEWKSKPREFIKKKVWWLGTRIKIPKIDRLKKKQKEARKVTSQPDIHIGPLYYNIYKQKIRERPY